MNKDLSNYEKLFVCKLKLQHLLDKIKEMEIDTELSVTEKISKIKIIREEIDRIKKEVTLLRNHNIN